MGWLADWTEGGGMAAVSPYIYKINKNKLNK